MKKTLLILAIALLFSCEDTSNEDCGCIKSIYHIEVTRNPTTITHVKQSSEDVVCQDEVIYQQIGEGNFWYRIVCGN